MLCLSIARYLTSSLIEPGGVREGMVVTSMDLSIFSIVSVQVGNPQMTLLLLLFLLTVATQVMVNILLLAGTIKKRPCHALPWLCANAVSLMIAMVRCGLKK